MRFEILCRNWLQKKIEEYYAHFRFLFDGIGDHCMILSLHNLGECREIFLGIIRYFKKRISDNLMPDEILNFEVNIYSDKDSLIHHNDFSVLSNLSRTKAYLCEIDGNMKITLTWLRYLLARCISISIRKLMSRIDMHILHFIKCSPVISAETVKFLN